MLHRVLWITTLEAGINRVLKFDPEVYKSLGSLSGKVIEIRLANFAESLYLCPSVDGIQLVEKFHGTPDTVLAGPLTSFLKMAVSGRSVHPSADNDITIEGDTDVAKRLQQLIRQIDIDVEEELSKFTGDVAAHQLGNLIRAGRRWHQRTVRTFKLNLEEYLQQESRQVPGRYEADTLFDRVDEIRADSERLELRIARLTDKVAAG